MEIFDANIFEGWYYLEIKDIARGSAIEKDSA